MKVTIITVTYNSASTLQKAIDSVKQQDYKNIEYIIVDGASTDSTMDVIKSNSNCITKVVSEPDKGIYDAFNKGIKLATGDIIGILNSDDTFANDRVISKIVAQFQEKKGDLLYGDLVYISKENDNRVIRYWKSKDFSIKSLKRGWMPPHPTLYCKKEIYERFGLFNDKLQISADYDFILRIFQEEDLKKIYLPEVLVKMSWGGKSNGNIGNVWRKLKEDYGTIKRNRIGGIFTLFLKNSSKITQFFKK